MSSPLASTVIDSVLFRDSFGTPAMRELFSDRALVQRYIDAEIALARAEARVGVIPAEAAAIIACESRIERIDFDHMRHETETVGYPILPLVHQLVAMCGDAGRYVHWGATTQDIMDTAVALQVRDAIDLVEADIRELRKILADLAVNHRDTAMAGRRISSRRFQ
jgi:3-carboxy-cis,cis-muconate cycloisomerase